MVQNREKKLLDFISFFFVHIHKFSGMFLFPDLIICLKRLFPSYMEQNESYDHISFGRPPAICRS